MSCSVVKPLLKESFPAKPKVTAKDIPDLTGRVMFVTGGNSGLGKETVKVRARRARPGVRVLTYAVQTLLQKNAKVYLGARSEKKAQEAIAELQALTGRAAIFVKLDLADLLSVKAAAADFLRQVCMG